MLKLNSSNNQKDGYFFCFFTYLILSKRVAINFFA
uniref:Uncharacterized protein n=1 Tax=Myoviridae sp. ct3OK4 TaxID=2825024 RepID=A0A8S5NX71_9CAUD|nr:MAG TPA: hypothetical protein [Myoviridae sp. ct3OK4]